MARRRNLGYNRYPFTTLFDTFGRDVIYTVAEDITAENVVEELNNALPIHAENALAIEYLDRYYRGDQPILYRAKKNRPEINNKVVVNITQYIVDSKTADLTGEPIQYVLRGTDEVKADEVRALNELLDDEDKSCDDTELVRWRSICGTAYRFVGQPSEKKRLFANADLSISVENPSKTFVVYYDDKTPAFSCQIRKNSDSKDIYYVYTDSLFFVIEDNEIINSGINGNGAIPVVEYPNNARRLSDIEITISLTDEINKLTSDRANGIEQFVCSWVKFVNCDIDIEKFRQVRDEGFFSVTSNEGAENRADVELMTQELNQSESQVTVDDLFNKLLIIQGIANREGNTGGDTGSAVQLRNGHSAQEQKAKISENIFKRSEKMALRLILNRLRIARRFDLLPNEVEVKISRSRNDNMLTKAETLQILINCGIDKARAIKTIDMWSDPEQVAYESRDVKGTMEMARETEEKAEQPEQTEVVETTTEINNGETESGTKNEE